MIILASGYWLVFMAGFQARYYFPFILIVIIWLLPDLVQYLRTLMQSSHDEARQKKFGLTPRELEIVSAVVAGYSNKEIAEYFKISEDTVKHHLSNIFDKLGVSTRLELALFAVNQALPLKSIA